ncbi:MAG: glycosyltransferase [Nitrosotalea sp.]
MKKNILLLSYYSSYGPQDTLDEYFSKKLNTQVFRINIPLPEMPFIKYIEFIYNKKKYTHHTILKPTLLSYFFHPLQISLLLLKNKRRYDTMIAQSALLVYVGFLLKMLKRCDTIIYYSHGFDPKRFPNKLTGEFYKFLDFTAAKIADYNWVLGEKMLIERKAIAIPEEKLFWVPIALPIKKIKITNNPPAYTLLFVGMLTQMNGVLVLPKIVKLLKRKIPTVKLDIIGDGPLMKKLQREIVKLHLQKNIVLYGLVQFEDFASSMSNHVVGIAPYAVSKDTMLHVSDSMKLRLYWAASLPVVTTKGYPFSKEVEENKLGFCATFNPKDFSEKILHLLQSKKIQQQIRLRARNYSKKFDQKIILDAIIKKMSR